MFGNDRDYIEDCRKSACEVCGLTNMLSLKVFDRQLDTHHKNGKKECAPEDIKTLCQSCHMRLHGRERSIVKIIKGEKPKLKLKRRKMK